MLFAAVRVKQQPDIVSFGRASDPASAALDAAARCVS